MSLFNRNKKTPPPKNPADYALFRQSPSDQPPAPPPEDVIDVQPTQPTQPTEPPTPSPDTPPSPNNPFFSSPPPTDTSSQNPAAKKTPPLFRFGAPKKPQEPKAKPAFSPSSSSPQKNTLLPFAILSILLAIGAAGARYYTDLVISDLNTTVSTLQDKLTSALTPTPWQPTATLFTALQTSNPSSFSYSATAKAITLNLAYPLQHPYSEYNFSPLNPANIPFVQDSTLPCAIVSPPQPLAENQTAVALDLSCSWTPAVATQPQ